jgi:hypothetical protein
MPINEAAITPDAPAESVVINQTFNDEAVSDLIADIPSVIRETKAGYKTTEFWVTVVTALAAMLEVAPVPDGTGGIAGVALAAVYALSRGIAKKGIPHIEQTPEA